MLFQLPTVHFSHAAPPHACRPDVALRGHQTNQLALVIAQGTRIKRETGSSESYECGWNSSGIDEANHLLAKPI
jgi:hypothetical protein